VTNSSFSFSIHEQKKGHKTLGHLLQAPDSYLSIESNPGVLYKKMTQKTFTEKTAEYGTHSTALQHVSAWKISLKKYDKYA